MAMMNGNLIGKREAAAELGIRDRRLVAFLIREHKIPVEPIGTKHCLDKTGFEMLRRAYQNYLTSS